MGLSNQFASLHGSDQSALHLMLHSGWTLISLLLDSGLRGGYLKNIQKLWATQINEVILIAPWSPCQPWFLHLIQLCVDQPRFLPYRLDLLPQPGYTSDEMLYHLYAWRLSCSTSKQQDFQKRSLGSWQLLGDPLTTTSCTMTEIDLLGLTAPLLASLLFSLFETHGQGLKVMPSLGSQPYRKGRGGAK